MPQNLDQPAASAAENEQMTVVRVALERFLNQQRPSRRSPCACRCGRSPATPAHRSEPGSSPLGLGQHRDHHPDGRSLDRSRDPHPRPARKLDLDRSRRRRQRDRCSRTRRNRHRRENRSRRRSATELLPPSEQLACVNPGGSCHLGSDTGRPPNTHRSRPLRHVLRRAQWLGAARSAVRAASAARTAVPGRDRARRLPARPEASRR